LGEAFAAEDGTALRGAERYGRILAALRACGPSLDLAVVVVARRRRTGTEHGHSLGLASLAAFGFVFELLVVEKKLFTGSEDKVGTAIYAFQHLVLKFH